MSMFAVIMCHQQKYKMLLNFVGMVWCVLWLVSCSLNDQYLQARQSNHMAAKYNAQLGLMYFSQGDRVRAQNKLLKALEQAPTSPEANSAMAYFMEKSGEVAKAHTYYANAMKFSHNDGAALNNFGTFLCRQGQYTLAEKYFLQAALDERYTHAAIAYENAGLCMMHQERKKAVLYFKKALEHDPTRKQARRELARINMQSHSLLEHTGE